MNVFRGFIVSLSHRMVSRVFHVNLPALLPNFVSKKYFPPLLSPNYYSVMDTRASSSQPFSLSSLPFLLRSHQVTLISSILSLGSAIFSWHFSSRRRLKHVDVVKIPEYMFTR